MLNGLSGEMIIGIFIAIMLASIVQRVSGFAFGIIILCILPYILPYEDVIAIVKILMVLICFGECVSCHKNIAWNIAIIPVLSMCFFDLIGIYLVQYLGSNSFKAYLGIFLALSGGYALFKNKKEIIKPTKLNGLIFGSFAGLCSGLFGAGGPFLAMYMNSIGLDKNSYFATTQGILIFTIIADVIMRGIKGLITFQAVKISLLAIPAALVGVFVGGMLFKRLDSIIIRKIVNWVMVVNGLYMYWTNC